MFIEVCDVHPFYYENLYVCIRLRDRRFSAGVPSLPPQQTAAVALEWEADQLTYEQMRRCAEAVARWLAWRRADAP